MYQTGKLYKSEKISATRAGCDVGIRLVGGPVSVTIYGGQTKPSSLGDMADIAEPGRSPFTSAGWLSIGALPKFVSFAGTATGIEVANVTLTEEGDIS